MRYTVCHEKIAACLKLSPETKLIVISEVATNLTYPQRIAVCRKISYYQPEDKHKDEAVCHIANVTYSLKLPLGKQYVVTEVASSMKLPQRTMT